MSSGQHGGVPNSGKSAHRLGDGGLDDFVGELAEGGAVARKVRRGDCLQLVREVAVLLRGPLEILRLEAVLKDYGRNGWS